MGFESIFIYCESVLILINVISLIYYIIHYFHHNHITNYTKHDILLLGILKQVS